MNQKWLDKKFEIYLDPLYQKNPLVLPHTKVCGLFVGFLGYRK